MNLSSEIYRTHFDSGVEITPKLCANLSPIDLLIASPGAVISLLQTLAGPKSLPSSSFKAITTYNISHKD